MIQIAIRAATASDESALLALATAEMEAHARFDERFRLRKDAASRYAVYLRERRTGLDSAVFVAESEGKVVGGVVASVRIQESFFETRRFGYVSDLVVAPEVRRRGVGRALWEKARVWLRAPGVDAIRLHVAAKSDAARAFWKSLGAAEFLTEMWIEADPARPPDPGAKPARAGKPAGAPGPGPSPVPESDPEPEPIEPGSPEGRVG